MFHFRPHRRSKHPSGHHVVRLRGEVTARTADRTKKYLLDALTDGPDVLVVDFGEVTYLGSDGCAPLFTAVLAARTTDTRLTFARAASTLRRVGLGGC
ncbi:STAS domain-containing protein [Streptomyces aureus]|uniref:STAS domain-containing protein n=1 Tax=Streptomyces aureus TaxID=193461 RepID=A0ABV4SZ35_9ACTN